MSKDICVSVIMPCYNCEDFIDESIKSLVQQTYKNFEVICINDGSTDGTLYKLHEWKKKNVLDMVIFNQENKGVSFSRNKGIENANGKYIVFLDADDKFSSKYIELMVKGVAGNDAAYCQITRNSEDVEKGSCLEFFIEENIVTMTKMINNPRKYNFYTYIYRTELLRRNDVLFDIETRFGEDKEFMWKYISYCKQIAFIDLPLYFYRQNEQSVSRFNITWRKTDTLKAMKRVEMHLKKICSPLSDKFENYMYPRTMWNVAKTFASAKERELFKRLVQEYDVFSCMKKTSKDKEFLIAFSSYLYIINPMLFYYSISICGK